MTGVGGGGAEMAPTIWRETQHVVYSPVGVTPRVGWVVYGEGLVGRFSTRSLKILFTFALHWGVSRWMCASLAEPPLHWRRGGQMKEAPTFLKKQANPLPQGVG